MNPGGLEFGGAIIKMLGGLTLVLLLVLGLAFWVKRFSNLTHKFGNGSLLKMIAIHRIGPKHSIALFQIGNKAFVAGISPENISYLTDVAVEDLNYQDKSRETGRVMPEKSFKEKLRGMMTCSSAHAEKEIEA